MAVPACHIVRDARDRARWALTEREIDQIIEDARARLKDVSFACRADLPCLGAVRRAALLRLEQRSLEGGPHALPI